MRHRLYIVEGLPCSGKSSVSAFMAEALAEEGKVCYVDEGTGDHPADYEFHALSPDDGQIVALADVSDEMREKLMPHKIYDGLPWETEMPLMLEKWREFVRTAEADTIYVFNSVLLQNPMCETMMRFDMPEEASMEYIRQIAEIIAPMCPTVVYLHNTRIADSVLQAAPERGGWLDAVIDYHTNSAYGKRIGAKGFDGYIRCLNDRQERETRILAQLPLQAIGLVNPQMDWEASLKSLNAWLACH